jgi:hypothetical protein
VAHFFATLHNLESATPANVNGTTELEMEVSRTLSELQPGDIYRIPLNDGSGVAFVRVVLQAKRLELSIANPLAFVSDDYLMQVSKEQGITDVIFHPDNVLINGVFVQRRGPWKKHGWEKVGELPLTLDEVEMPCFCSRMEDDHGKTIQSFCRGEIRFPLPPSADPDAVGCFLCKKAPESLQSDLFMKGRELIVREWFWRCDGRFSNKTQQLMQESGVDVSSRYAALLPKTRLPIYARAIR